MKRSHSLLLLIAGTTASAFAQNTEVLFEASNDSGMSWARSVEVMAGQVVLVRVRIRLVNTTETVLGLAGVTFQPTLTNWNPAVDARLAFSTPDGTGTPEEPQTNTGRISPFASSGMNSGSFSGLLSSHVDGGSVLRFAGANCVTPTTNLAWGVSSGQVPQNLDPTSFRTGTDAVMFRYAVRLGGPDARELVASVDLATILNQRSSWYRRPTAQSLRAQVIQSTILSATIHLVPVPSILTPLLAFPILASRRRR